MAHYDATAKEVAIKSPKLLNTAASIPLQYMVNCSDLPRPTHQNDAHNRVKSNENIQLDKS